MKKWNEEKQQYVPCDTLGELIEDVIGDEKFESAYIWHDVSVGGDDNTPWRMETIDERMVENWGDAKERLDLEKKKHYVSAVVWTDESVIVECDCEGQGPGYVRIPRNPAPSRFSLMF